VFVLLGIPLLLIGAAAIAAAISVRRSWLRISADGVEVRNYPQPPKLIPLSAVDRFEATPPAGNLSSVRPKTAVLVLTDGSRIPVRRVDAPDAGYGVDALNARVQSLRGGN
jgi:hypothetical protein